MIEKEEHIVLFGNIGNFDDERFAQSFEKLV